MTITGIAEKVGVSKQAVYQRIKKAGIDVNSLRDAKSGALTEKGEQIILALYQGTDDAQLDGVNKVDGKLLDELTQKLAEAEKARDALRQACEVLTAKNEQLTERVAEMTQERDYLRTALAQEQLNVQRLLPAPQEQKESRWARVIAALKGR